MILLPIKAFFELFNVSGPVLTGHVVNAGPLVRHARRQVLHLLGRALLPAGVKVTQLHVRLVGILANVTLFLHIQT